MPCAPGWAWNTLFGNYSIIKLLTMLASRFRDVAAGWPRQPLIPVIEMPSIKLFWVKKNSTMMGSATSVLAAIR